MKTLFQTLITLFLFTGFASGQYIIDWSSIDTGGGTSSGGSFLLSSTVGQADAGPLSGGPYTLKGGFRAVIAVPSTTGTPELFIQQLSDGSVIISRSPATPGFALEQTDRLVFQSWSTAPSGNPTPPISASASTRFYRLRK